MKQLGKKRAKRKLSVLRTRTGDPNFGALMGLAFLYAVDGCHLGALVKLVRRRCQAESQEMSHDAPAPLSMRSPVFPLVPLLGDSTSRDVGRRHPR
jgi:hypothetical protein